MPPVRHRLPGQVAHPSAPRDRRAAGPAWDPRGSAGAGEAGVTRSWLCCVELRHRRRARAEDRIRAARDTGLRNLPLHGAAHHQGWLEVVSLALDLLACLPMPALDGPAGDTRALATTARQNTPVHKSPEPPSAR